MPTGDYGGAHRTDLKVVDERNVISTSSIGTYYENTGFSVNYGMEYIGIE